MKNIYPLLPIILSLFFVCSCKTADQPKQEKMKHSIQIKLVSEADIQINNTEATITLYGNDQMMADAQASIITQQKIKLTSLPMIVDLALPSNPSSLIQPAVSAKENAKYYIAFHCDNNQNGTNDQGDLKVDFKNGFPHVNLETKEAQTIFIKKY